MRRRWERGSCSADTAQPRSGRRDLRQRPSTRDYSPARSPRPCASLRSSTSSADPCALVFPSSLSLSLALGSSLVAATDHLATVWNRKVGGGRRNGILPRGGLHRDTRGSSGMRVEFLGGKVVSNWLFERRSNGDLRRWRWLGFFLKGILAEERVHRATSQAKFME